MPQVIRGIRASSDSYIQKTTPASPTSPVEQNRRVTFEINGQNTSNSLDHTASQESRPQRSHHNQKRDTDPPEGGRYLDSRAATHREFKRRPSTLQAYYLDHPELLPQLPFTFRHGFKRWKLGGYIALMVFDACVVPIGLYYVLTFGGSLQGYIVFAVITAVWGGPTYVEFAVRSRRLIRKEDFYKPLGMKKKWAFDITNWILVLTITAVTALLIVGAAPHIVFMRVLSMPAPAILFCLAGPIFLLNVYHACGWVAPFQISSTAKGKKVLPGIYYVVEDIVAVNSGGGRPFREGLAARYNASPIFRKMIRDLSWFWSAPGLFMAAACTVIVCIHQVPKPIAYGLGWGIPFLWAGIWGFITLPWVRTVMHNERRCWEEDSSILKATMMRLPPLHPPGLDLPVEQSESIMSGETAVRQDEEAGNGSETRKVKEANVTP